MVGGLTEEFDSEDFQEVMGKVTLAHVAKTDYQLSDILGGVVPGELTRTEPDDKGDERVVPRGSAHEIERTWALFEGNPIRSHAPHALPHTARATRSAPDVLPRDRSARPVPHSWMSVVIMFPPPPHPDSANH
jgi:hypothetical protein